MIDDAKHRRTMFFGRFRFVSVAAPGSTYGTSFGACASATDAIACTARA